MLDGAVLAVPLTTADTGMVCDCLWVETTAIVDDGALIAAEYVLAIVLTRSEPVPYLDWLWPDIVTDGEATSAEPETALTEAEDAPVEVSAMVLPLVQVDPVH